MFFGSFVVVFFFFVNICIGIVNKMLFLIDFVKFNNGFLISKILFVDICLFLFWNCFFVMNILFIEKFIGSLIGFSECVEGIVKVVCIV